MELPTDSTSPLNLALDAVKRYREQKQNALKLQDIETLREIETRLLRLVTQFNELIQINKLLMESDPLRIHIHFDPSSETITFGNGDKSIHIKLNRADPNIPIARDNESVVGAYIPGALSSESAEIVQIKSRMESLLEDFYHSAHRILKLVRTLPRMTKTESRAITIVRNKLVEHPDAGDFYSFGWSSSGPIVRPFHRPGRQWVDAGLIPNTNEFVDALVKAFE
jgi:hypothetical protein